MFKITVIYYFLVLINAGIINYTENNVTNCIANLLNSKENSHLLILYSWSVPQDILLKEVLSLQISKIVFNVDKLAIKVYGKFDFYLLIVDSVKSLQHFLRILNTYTMDNPDGKFIIYYPRQQIVEFDEIFQICWTYYIINIVIIHYNGFIYSYYPFKKNKCGNVIQSEFLGFCNETIANVFPNKIPLVTNNCTLKLIALKIPPYVINMTDSRNPGVEVMIVREIARYINFTVKNITHNFINYGAKQFDGTYTKMFQMIYTKQADLMIGMVRINSSDFKDFDSTVPHLFDQATWHIASALPVSKWKNMYRIFSVKIWILLTLIIIINCFVWWNFGQNPRELHSFHDFQTCFLVGLGVLLSFSAPIPKGKILRGLFILWSFFSILMVTTYESKLISILMKTVYEYQITKGSEILEQGIKFGYNEAVRNIFSDESHKTNHRYYMEFENCPVTTLKCIERAAYQKDFAVFKNRRQIRYLTRR